jgi:hypothetical protein
MLLRDNSVVVGARSDPARTTAIETDFRRHAYGAVVPIRVNMRAAKYRRDRRGVKCK